MCLNSLKFNSVFFCWAIYFKNPSWTGFIRSATLLILTGGIFRLITINCKTVLNSTFGLRVNINARRNWGTKVRVYSFRMDMINYSNLPSGNAKWVVSLEVCKKWTNTNMIDCQHVLCPIRMYNTTHQVLLRSVRYNEFYIISKFKKMKKM